MKKWSCKSCGAMNPELEATCECGHPKGDAVVIETSSSIALLDEKMKALESAPAVMLEPEIHHEPKLSEPVPVIDLVATNPEEMRHCQHELIGWVEAKLTQVHSEVEQAKSESLELQQAFDYAVKQKWKKDTIGKHRDLAIKRIAYAEARVSYYTKIKTALRAGYYIVPPMGMEIFAIRTDQKNPSKMRKYLSFGRGGNFEQKSKTLPQGEGEYKNPQPVVSCQSWDEKKDDRGVTVKPYYASDWESIEFPVNMIKPRIMKAADHAMALKVFDEMGVLPQDYRRNPDPVILGRIYEPNRGGYFQPKAVTFMIAWHLNTKDL